jgi:hypothetical protein
MVAKAISTIQNPPPIHSFDSVKQILFSLQLEHTTDELFLFDAFLVGAQFDSGILRDELLLFGIDREELKSADLVRCGRPEVVKATMDYERRIK